MPNAIFEVLEETVRSIKVGKVTVTLVGWLVKVA